MFKIIVLYITPFIILGCAATETDENMVFPFYRNKKKLVQHIDHCGDNLDYYFNINAKYPLSNNELKLKLRNQKIVCKSQKSGYITFNFVVNCNGIPNAPYIFQLDDSFKKTQFDRHLTKQLEKFVMGLDEYKSFNHSSYYYYFTFIIQDGEIIDILP